LRFSKKSKKCVKKGKKPQKDKVPKKLTCDLFADPHVKDFKGKGFEAQRTGDFILYKSEFISAHYRGRSFGKWVGVVNWLVKLGEDRIRSIGFKQVAINGQRMKGNSQTLAGGKVTIAGNKFTVTSNHGEIIDWIAHGSFFNGYVKSQVKGTRGICNHQFLHSKAFRHPMEGEKVPKPLGKCAKQKKNENWCHKKQLVGAGFNNCVFDLCQNLPKAMEKTLMKEKKEGK